MTRPAARALEIEQLVVRYYGRSDDALHDVSLVLEPGVFVSVAGANGAGKSTLALVALALLPIIAIARLTGALPG